ncbi:hypothetical protein [Burkholderia sp. Tr-20390]|uniref:hypothetical protein n=1 Tax=Burkholderia sp. Tr-20390 TaxID=2703904 RepID=UPI001980F619|nr:hypothetical protein [Burkholderia sp. Tr-20390]MBN3729427.1 hypothetical protein [Burkholderia sp. Tr-20390]
MRNAITPHELADEAGAIRDRWLSRPDAMAIAFAIAMSESWPRRWFVSIAAAMCGVMRAADRMLCVLEDDRGKRLVSPNALRYLKGRVSREVMERVQRLHELEVEMRHRALGGSFPPPAAGVTVEVLIIELGAGYLADRRKRMRARGGRVERFDAAIRRGRE